MYLSIENLSVINQYASKYSREREGKTTDAFVEYKSKIVAGLMIFFFHRK